MLNRILYRSISVIIFICITNSTLFSKVSSDNEDEKKTKWWLGAVNVSYEYFPQTMKKDTNKSLILRGYNIDFSGRFKKNPNLVGGFGVLIINASEDNERVGSYFFPYYANLHYLLMKSNATRVFIGGLLYAGSYDINEKNSDSEFVVAISPSVMLHYKIYKNSFLNIKTKYMFFSDHLNSDALQNGAINFSIGFSHVF